MVYFRKSPYYKRWYYLSIFGWKPFSRFNHGGWMYFNWKWIKHHANV